MKTIVELMFECSEIPRKPKAILLLALCTTLVVLGLGCSHKPSVSAAAHLRRDRKQPVTAQSCTLNRVWIHQLEGLSAVASPDVNQCEAACQKGERSSCVAAAMLRSYNAKPTDQENANALFKPLCTAGYDPACAALGAVLIKSPDEAVVARGLSMLDNACKNGEPHACTVIGNTYRAKELRLIVEVIGESSPLPLALAAYSLGCDAGGATACDHMTRLLSISGRDPSIADGYQKACDMGSPLACGHLALMYHNEEITPPHAGAAVTYFEQSCDGGFTYACFIMGMLCVKERDMARATDSLERACAGGIGQGCAMLGRIYHDDAEVPRNDVKTAIFGQRGCDLGDALGCRTMGELYQDGWGVKEDPTKAEGYFKAGCDGGDLFACNRLGVMYAEGRGIPVDEAKGIALIKKACDGNYALGCVSYGRAHTRGIGVPKDQVKGVEFLDKACMLGDIDGCLDQARMLYWDGPDTTRDEAKALALFELNCTGANARTCQRIAFDYLGGTNVVRNEVKALTLFLGLCRWGHLSSCNVAGYLYMNGYGRAIPQDEAKAAELLEYSCNHHDQKGCSDLEQLRRQQHGGP